MQHSIISVTHVTTPPRNPTTLGHIAALSGQNAQFPALAGKGQLFIFMPGRSEERTEVLKALCEAFSGRLLLSATTSFHVPQSQDLERPVRLTMN